MIGQKKKDLIKKVIYKVYVFLLPNLHFNLATLHFRVWSSESHLNYKAFQKIIELTRGQSLQIVETGTSAWGTDSTRFWDSYIRLYGGTLWSVDIRSEAAVRLNNQMSKSSHLITDDSVTFLNRMDKISADIYYLDSWDVDWNNPLPAAIHGLNEFHAIKERLKEGNLIFIDDTPTSFDFVPTTARSSMMEFKEKHGVIPGKGALVLKEVADDPRFEILFHEYAMIIGVVR